MIHDPPTFGLKRNRDICAQCPTLIIVPPHTHTHIHHHPLHNSALHRAHTCMQGSSVGGYWSSACYSCNQASTFCFIVGGRKKGSEWDCILFHISLWAPAGCLCSIKGEEKVMMIGNFCSQVQSAWFRKCGKWFAGCVSSEKKCWGELSFGRHIHLEIHLPHKLINQIAIWAGKRPDCLIPLLLCCFTLVVKF